jgi:hypothetical protein
MAHFVDARTLGARPVSTASTASDASADAHAAEAVVYTASRATSVGSGRVLSNQSLSPGEASSAGSQARFMPFTKSGRVPVPGSDVSMGNEKLSPRMRVTSQRAKVVTGHGRDRDGDEDDDLAMSARYVQEWGADGKGSSSRRMRGV